MIFDTYLPQFRKAESKIDKKLLKEKKLETATGVVLDSVYLKLYKKSWANLEEDPLTAETRIFFSIWVNESTLRQQKLFYNIHALKLRKLNGYKIESRKFASTFRKSFIKKEEQWPNVSIDFGPLTLMEGWMELNDDKISDNVLMLANNFFEIDIIIDQTLSEFKNKIAKQY